MDWKELEALAKLHETGKLSLIGEDNYNTLLQETEKEIEHPEWYENACLCKTCLSYGD